MRTAPRWRCCNQVHVGAFRVSWHANNSQGRGTKSGRGDVAGTVPIDARKQMAAAPAGRTIIHRRISGGTVDGLQGKAGATRSVGEKPFAEREQDTGRPSRNIVARQIGEENI